MIGIISTEGLKIIITFFILIEDKPYNRRVQQRTQRTSSTKDQLSYMINILQTPSLNFTVPHRDSNSDPLAYKSETLQPLGCTSPQLCFPVNWPLIHHWSLYCSVISINVNWNRNGNNLFLFREIGMRSRNYFENWNRIEIAIVIWKWN